jgi:hypothetical protein
MIVIAISRVKCHHDVRMRLSAYSRTAAGRGSSTRAPQREQKAAPCGASAPHCTHLIERISSTCLKPREIMEEARRAVNSALSRTLAWKTPAVLRSAL